MNVSLFFKQDTGHKPTITLLTIIELLFDFTIA